MCAVHVCVRVYGLLESMNLKSNTWSSHIILLNKRTVNDASAESKSDQATKNNEKQQQLIQSDRFIAEFTTIQHK